MQIPKQIFLVMLHIYFSPNRFDKRLPTALRAWVSTQHSKTGGRDMYPIFDDEEKNEWHKILDSME